MSMLRTLALFLLTAGITLAQAPSVFPNGIVNGASFDAPVAPGALVSIFGANFAAQPAGAATIPLPLSLGGVSVRFNGIPAPMLYVNAGQINAQLPWEISTDGPVNVVVTTGSGSSAPQAVQVGPFSPGVFAVQGYAVAIQLDGSLAAPSGAIPQTATHPTGQNQVLQVLVTGLGKVNPPGVTGNNSLDATRNTTAAPLVFIGGISAHVSFSGLSPQFVGVYQVNVDVPPNAPVGDAVPFAIQIGGRTSIQTKIAIGGAGWLQWGQNPQHTGNISAVGQDLSRILANIVYDPLTPDEKAANDGDLVAHFEAPLVDGNDVYMEFKTGAFSADSYATQTWGVNKFSWQNSQLVQVQSFATDWKAPGSSKDFWEPVFHPALANGALYVPGASGGIIKFDKVTGAMLQRIAPFGTDSNTYETGPIAADANGNLFYNAIQVVVDPKNGFLGNDAIDSWLVKVAPDGTFSTVSYKALTSAEAPAGNARCLGTFPNNQLPWPPSPTAVPGTGVCGSQRVALNIAPAVAPDGTIYSVTRAHFNARYGFLVAVAPNLTKKWVASLRDRFHDGCGVPVSQGGWLPPNGAPGGCRAGALLGVEPATNRFGDGQVVDSSSSSPTIAPDGSVLYGAYTRYNYAQGHLMHFDANGNYLGAYGFGWDYTPAIYSHDGTWSVVIKNNHYGDIGSYCNNQDFCPPDRSATNPDSPEQYFVSQLNSNLTLEWSFQNTNTESCSRNPDGTIGCVSDHPAGFEWCVNAPVIDANGVVYANSEDGNVFAIQQGGILKQKIFQQLALGAAYTPASLGPDGKIYTQNDGHLFVVGK